MPGQELADYLAYILASAHRSMRMGLSESIDDSDLTEEHWRILHVLSDEQGRSMGELAEQALLNGPALTKNIDKLVSRGLVQRAVDAQDSRKVLVFISDVGLKTAKWLNERVDAHHHSIEAALGPQKMMQLKRLLRSFAVTSASASSGSPRVSARAASTPTLAASRRSALPAKSQRRRKQSR
jgi:DNA-binding MarR family transcriptional regulator